MFVVIHLLSAEERTYAMTSAQDSRPYPPLFIVSGGYGTSGSQLAQTALAQFSGVTVPVIVVPHVNHRSELERAVSQAAAAHGTILHTLVNPKQRADLVEIARQKNVVTIDLIGTVLSRLTLVVGREPMGQPGMYRQLREDYFRRVEAIEFTVAHDDGKRLEDLPQAEIVLIGPSRVGKTPLSMYLSVLGWKVANLPLATALPPPYQLFELDRRRVVALTIDPAQLLTHRKRRQRSLGTGRGSGYAELESIQRELDHADLISRQGGFPVLNVTDRPIEETAETVISLIEARRH